MVEPHKLAHLLKSIPSASEHEYDYEPRPPNVPTDTVPICPHEFQHHFSSRDGNCPWPIFHKCNQPFPGKSDVESIPKKICEFKLDSKERPKEWGLQVVYRPSFIHILIYHILALVCPFTFWVVWQVFHPNDVSTVAVPASVVISLISCFWTFAGTAGAFKEPGST